MIKVAPPASSGFHSFKCGEIFCLSPTVYDVTCCLCAVKMHLDEFSIHFEMEHLALIEGSINLELFECKPTAILVNDANIESLNTKVEDDPIKHEDLSVYSDNHSETLEQLLKETDKIVTKVEHVQKFSSVKLEVNDLNICKKTEVEICAKKPKSTNSKRSKIKSGDVKELKASDENLTDELKNNNHKATKVENAFDSNKGDNNLKDFDDFENRADRDWLAEDEASKTDSEAGSDNIKDELPYPCHTCKRSYRSKYGLQKHNQIMHNPNKKRSKHSKTPKVEHKCDQCNEVFRIARDLRGHKYKHTGIFCDICGKSFTQTGNMMRHKLRHTGIKDHKCTECGKEFFTGKELKSHMICHTKLMPVICEICGKQCRHRGVLTAHMRRHTGERPAKCDVCGKCFFSIHDLNVHAVAHTSERPFKCDICGSTFQRKKALRVHKLIHSKDRKHVCKICGKGFAQSGGLKSHMRSHNTAIEHSTIDSAQQPLTSHMLENQSSQAADCASELTTSTCKTINNPDIVILSENNMLEQYTD